MSQHKKNFYAVAKGRQPGLYRGWYGSDGAEAQVKDFVGAVYKGFYELEDALSWLQERGIRVPEHDALRPKEADHRIQIYTDGGVVNNPGPGGYGVVIIQQDQRIELSGGFRLTTNNRMELMACIAALERLATPSAVTIYTDSKYLVDAIEKGWVFRWRSHGWRKNKEQKAENADLWSKLLTIYEQHDAKLVWVKGHGGKPENERCDQLAAAAARGSNLAIDRGYEKAEDPQLF